MNSYHISTLKKNNYVNSGPKITRKNSYILFISLPCIQVKDYGISASFSYASRGL